jgi:hypothetical protein
MLGLGSAAATYYLTKNTQKNNNIRLSRRKAKTVSGNNNKFFKAKILDEKHI